jgi:hypothetical protein
MVIAAIYSPPRHAISHQEYEDFLLQLGPHYLVAGDWNARHTAWGSRLIRPKGRNLLNIIQQHNLNYISTGEPTYWPTALNKIPDLLDFAIIITLSNPVIWKKPPAKLGNRDTNWAQFQGYRREADHSPSSVAVVKNCWGYTSTLPYALTANCLII